MRPLELSADEFRRLAGEVVDLSAQFLGNLDARPIHPATSGAETERLFLEDLPERGLGAGALAALGDLAAHSRAQNGRFFGYVQGPGEPVAALGDLAASVLNQNMTAWRSSPSGVTIERTVVRWLAQAVGCRGFFGH
jgi:glutamate/tyrosine decarboxylase-like PLP-dependent enzyme